MEQAGQSGPHSGAQVPQQAVGEGADLLRTLSPTAAPLTHQPGSIYSPNLDILFFFFNFVDALMDPETHRKKESSRESAERKPRPAETQSWSASWDRQVEAECRENSSRPERTVAGFPPTSARPSMLGACAWRFTGTSPDANWWS